LDHYPELGLRYRDIGRTGIEQGFEAAVSADAQIDVVAAPDPVQRHSDVFDLWRGPHSRARHRCCSGLPAVDLPVAAHRAGFVHTGRRAPWHIRIGHHSSAEQSSWLPLIICEPRRDSLLALSLALPDEFGVISALGLGCVKTTLRLVCAQG